MNSFLENIKDVFNSGDPEASTWFLVHQTYLPFTLCGIYILFAIVIGPAIMKNKKPFRLRSLMVVYDFLLVGTYMACVVVCLWCLQHTRLEQWCKEETLEAAGDAFYTMIRTFWIIYILKYIEFFDTENLEEVFVKMAVLEKQADAIVTVIVIEKYADAIVTVIVIVFFVLRKKQNQITFLHIGHHIVIPILGWVIFRTERSGFQGIVVVVNSVTHILMYTYYGLAALGRQYTKYLWWKKYLSQIQMIQLLLIILLVTVVAPLFGCGTSVFSYIMEICLAPLFLYIFYKFFKSKYKTVQVPLDKFVIINDVPYVN